MKQDVRFSLSSARWLCQKTWSSLILTFLLLSPDVALLHPKAEDAAAIASKILPSVVMLTVSDREGNLVAIGSGFVVAKERVATSLHVVIRGLRVSAKVAGDKNSYVAESDIALDSKADVAVLHVPGLAAHALELGGPDKLEVGHRIYVAGNPRGLEGTFAEGLVSGFRDYGNVRLIQISAPISPGSSGGPVLGTNGLVVGIAVATFKDSQNLNFAVPADLLKPLLAKEAKITSMAELSKSTTRQSIFPEENSIADAVHPIAFAWGWGYDFSFTIRNRLRDAVSNLRILALAFDESDELLDSTVIDLKSNVQIGPRLATRVSGHFNHPSVNATSAKRVELRTLDYEVIQTEEAFVETLRKDKGITNTVSGLYYTIVSPGQGKRPTIRSDVTTHYRGTLVGGREFDSSIVRGEPATFSLSYVIPGLTEGLQLIGEGGRIKLFVPPSLAYGERGVGSNIPPNSWLIFEVELLRVEEK